MSPTKKYKLTPEHRAQLEPWCDRWIRNAMSTAPHTEEDRARLRAAIRGLYEAAGLKPPPDHRIVIVPSPMVAAFASGFAAAIWWRKRNDEATAATIDAATADATAAATDDAIDAATVAATAAATITAIDAATVAATAAATVVAAIAATAEATADATVAATDAATAAATAEATADAADAATVAATAAATAAATIAATIEAIDAATIAATIAATDVAIDAATVAATIAATDVAIDAATDVATADQWFQLGGCSPLGLARLARQIGGAGAAFLLSCANRSWYMRSGGNQWSGWAAFLSFFRHVAQLPLDYSKWQHYEAAAELGGPRYTHKEFCIVSERPEVLTVDEQNQPHNDTGPFCRWRDGSALYAVHGVRVPRWLIERPELLTQARIDEETNEAVRRVMIDRYHSRAAR